MQSASEVYALRNDVIHEMAMVLQKAGGGTYYENALLAEAAYDRGAPAVLPPKPATMSASRVGAVTLVPNASETVHFGLAGNRAPKAGEYVTARIHAGGFVQLTR